MILHGDCLDLLPTLAEKSVQCCVTSPPYFGLRNYGIPPSHWPEITINVLPGLPPITVPAETVCLGLESSIWAFIAHTVHVFRLVHRTLKDDSTLWVNIGDSYAANHGSGSVSPGAKQSSNAGSLVDTIRDPKRVGFKQKDMMGIPWLLAFALRADGWYLRQDIIWSKPNPMPESTKDRCTKAHEYLFLFSKSKRYYFDAAAIAEPASPNTHARCAQDVENQAGSQRAHGGEGRDGRPMKAMGGNGVGWGHGTDEPKPRTVGRRKSRHGCGELFDRIIETRDSGSTRNSFARTTKYSAGIHGQKPQHRPDRENINYGARPDGAAQIGSAASHRMGREPDGVSPKTEAATDGVKNNPSFAAATLGHVDTRNKRSVWTIPTFAMKEAHYATFPPALVEPCILAGTKPGQVVLDPFFGSGTTGVVAEKLGREWVGCEIGEVSVDIAKRRTTGVQKPLLVTP